jgi:hypothetical protein
MAHSNRVPDMADAHARLLRLRAHGLAQRLEVNRAGIEGTGVVELVSRLIGVQAQEARAAALALRARSTGLVASDVEHARVEDRTVIRTWCLRGTLHLAAAADLGWLLALLGPPAEKAGRRRRAELGLDPSTADRGVRILSELVAGRGPHTRAEIAAHLAAQGVPSAGQATIHLIGLAALRGLVCYGPFQGVQGREPTFVSLPAWLPAGTAGEGPADPPAELARRYLAAYGPASPVDLSAWSGLSIAVCRAAWQRLAGDLVEVRLRGGSAWMLRAHAERPDLALPPRPLVNLVPGYDPYLLGYRSRELAVLPEHARRIHPGGGVLRPTLLVNGLAAGTWHLTGRGRRSHVQIEPFEEMDEPALADEAEDVTHFLEG